MKLKKHIKLTAVLTLETGLHIGGSSEKIEIGGIDNTVIKDPLTKLPYIPGSSLKGKMRSLLEYDLGKVSKDGKPWSYKDSDEKERDAIIRIFGNSGTDEEIKIGPTRIVMRDAHWTENVLVKNPSPSDLVEIKTENVINRLTGTAEHPRSAERVPAGVSFNMELLFRIFEGFDTGKVSDEELFYRYIPRGLELLQIDCLGGYGSRGYGKVSFGGFVLHDKDLPNGIEKFNNIDGFKTFAKDKYPS
jgi:CRISPR-associated protein Csm3